MKPVYIAINVKIGCIPNCPLTILGSIICLTIVIINHKINTPNANFISPLKALIIAHGIITLPDPNIGKASTNAIPIAINKGYLTFKCAILKIYNPINEIIKAALYIRVSTEEQAKHGYSLSSQKQRLIEYCKEQNYMITDIYIDEGKTARTKLKNRTELLRLIEDAKQKKFNRIIIWRLLMTVQLWYWECLTLM